MDIVMRVTAIAFLVGVGLVVVGALWHAISGRARGAGDLVSDFWKAIRWLFRVLFDTTGKYSAGQRLMAAGFLLMLISGVIWVSLALADAVGGDDDGAGTTTTAPTTTG
jgi:hypothetical protein